MQPDSTIPVLTIPGTGLEPLVVSTFHNLVTLLFTVIIPWLERAGIGFIHFAVVISFPVSLFFIIGIIYSVEQLKIIKKKDAEKNDVKIEPAFVPERAAGSGSHDFTMRWKRLLDLLNSPNENDWKQAIIQADLMLEEMLRGLGYQGDTIGDMLRRVEPGEMKNLDNAGEAHGVRNKIAHTPGFVLDHHIAIQTMHKFRAAFEEFYYI